MWSRNPRRETLSTATQMPTASMAAPASCNEEEEDVCRLQPSIKVHVETWVQVLYHCPSLIRVMVDHF